MIGRALLLAAACVLAGCSVAPPTDLVFDPELAALGRPLPAEARWRAPPLSIAPVEASYLRPGSAFPPDEARPAAEGAPNSWATPPLDGADLQRRLARVLSFALYEGRAVSCIDPGSVAAMTSRSVCAAADERRAQLLLHVDVTENRVSWVGRDIVWWVNLALLYTFTVFPVLFIPDETYEVGLAARVTVVHVRTGRRILQREFSGVQVQSLNHFQRGFDASGLVGLHPFFLDANEADYGTAHAALLPHALKKLERAIAEGLRESLPAALDRPDVRKILGEGTEETARTYALVVGHDGPRRTVPRAPLRCAGNDAEAVAAWLLGSGTVHSKDHLHLLVGEDATREKIFEKVQDLAPRLLGHDRLVFFYAGYGTTDAGGAPELVLGEERLAISELASALGTELVERGNNPRVVFLLDTSFGPQLGRGRTYRSDSEPGGPPPNPATYLDALARKDLGWCVIAAAGPAETAFEIGAATDAARHGFFTSSLLAGLRGRADTKPRDGLVTAAELAAYLAEVVPEGVRPVEQTEQNPERRGADETIVIGVVPSR